MQRVAIIGLGLIGASIGLGLKQWATQEGKRDPVLYITGFDVSLDHQNYAKKIKAVDRTEWNMGDAIKDAELIIIATPVKAIREVMEQIAQRAPQDATVTDTGSTKVQVMQWADQLLPPTMNFIGGHPMAGSHQSIEGASATLFENATWCVAPAVNATEDSLQNVLGLVTALGADSRFIDPHEHDGFVGAISHLPMMLSVALMRSVAENPAWREMRELSAGGFRDVSRLAGGSPEMHRDICDTNRENISRWVGNAIEELEKLQRLVADPSEESSDTLFDELVKAQDARADWATVEHDGKLLQKTEGEISNISVTEQMQQMFFGTLFRRRPGADSDKKTRR